MPGTAPISDAAANPYLVYLPALHLHSACVWLPCYAMVDFLPGTAPITGAANPYPGHLPALHLVAPTEGPTAPRNCHTQHAEDIIKSKCVTELSSLLSSEVK